MVECDDKLENLKNALIDAQKSLTDREDALKLAVQARILAKNEMQNFRDENDRLKQQLSDEKDAKEALKHDLNELHKGSSSIGEKRKKFVVDKAEAQKVCDVSANKI